MESQFYTVKTFINMEKGYYTPEKKEFHLGFIYHEKVGDKLEAFCVDTFNDIPTEQCFDSDIIRVKYLNCNDMERLGFANWKTGNEHANFNECSKSVNERQYLCLRSYDDGDIKIFTMCKENINRQWDHFYGKIKNISELRTILCQIGHE